MHQIKMASLTHLIGQVLDAKYRIEKQLGEGGMGAVFLAMHLGTKRLVALKVIAPQLMANTEFVERFKREAEAAGRLRHPNVVNVTDFGFARVAAEPIAYLVMEYLDGQTLSALLQPPRPLPLEFVAEIAEQVCLAIDKAHQQGIIHRDLKPDNIWLEPNGRGSYNVKVLDFGLAKLRDPAPANAPSDPPLTGSASEPTRTESVHRASTAVGVSSYSTLVDPSASTLVDTEQGAAASPTALTAQAGELSHEASTIIDHEKETQPIDPVSSHEGQSPRTNPAAVLTRAGTIMGTPLYMSPEQCRGELLDPASDLYSLGVIIYQMLAGEPPFTGDRVMLLWQHMNEPPSPLEVKRPDVPRSVAALVMSALSKKPAERAPDAAAFDCFARKRRR